MGPMDEELWDDEEEDLSRQADEGSLGHVCWSLLVNKNDGEKNGWPSFRSVSWPNYFDAVKNIC